MWKPPEYPGPCFDLHFDRFDGLIFEAEKPFENVCAAGASPAQLREYLFLHLFDCKPQNIVAVVVHALEGVAAYCYNPAFSACLRLVVLMSDLAAAVLSKRTMHAQGSGLGPPGHAVLG